MEEKTEVFLLACQEKVVAPAVSDDLPTEVHLAYLQTIFPWTSGKFREACENEVKKLMKKFNLKKVDNTGRAWVINYSETYNNLIRFVERLMEFTIVYEGEDLNEIKEAILVYCKLQILQVKHTLDVVFFLYPSNQYGILMCQDYCDLENACEALIKKYECLVG